MIDERLKEYFGILQMYHKLPNAERPKMLAGYFRAASIAHKDPFMRELLNKFLIKESRKYGYPGSNNGPKSVA